MPYIYPQFSKHEGIGFRLGGAGLGNLLFIWARSIVTAEKYECELIWPTWPSLKIGPWIRHEKDKRLYNDLFKNNLKMISGIPKYRILLQSNKMYCKDFNEVDWINIKKKDVIVYSGFQMNFEGLLEHRDRVVNIITKSLADKGQKAMKYDASREINVHVRLGDFSPVNQRALAEGQNNTRIRIEWYVAVVNKIRQAAGWTVPVNIFSDGTDKELQELLSLANVRRKTFGNSIGDIIGLSRAPVMVASGSSFSLWARYIGSCNSISYPNQMKDRVVKDKKNMFEIEIADEDDFSEEVKKKIREIYRYD